MSVITNIMQWLYACLPTKAGVVMQYFFAFRRLPNLKNPQRFTEKIQWMKIYGRLEKLSCYVDKYAVREYVTSCIGEEYLIPCFSVISATDKIPWDSLPNRFVIKATHGSGFNILVKDKSQINFNAIGSKIEKWLSRDYSRITKELQYKNCTRKVLFEEYLDINENEPYDYKYFCVNGKIEVIQILMYSSHHKIYGIHFNNNWQYLSLPRKDISELKTINLPSAESILKMQQIVCSLAKPFPFVRVDLYYVKGRVFFGELTFCPTSGLIKFYPDELDYKFLDNFSPENFINP